MKVSRRRFAKTGSAALVGLSFKGERTMAGSFVNDSFDSGHRLRDRAAFSPVQRVETFPVVIVGGGIAGLSAAWQLNRRGFKDFVLLEMEREAGGNARSGENEVTKYPWAAHYVPAPGPGATYARELFEELGALRNGRWDERYLCFTPQERLFLHGRWQEGVEPATGLSTADHDQFRKLDDLLAGFRARGQFTIPMERGLGTDAAGLDRISFSAWLRAQGLDSRPLHWYMNYCCRDDYGALASQTSAWAGIHYFASREHEDDGGTLTWPEGNGWIVRQLLQRVAPFVRTDRMVHRIAQRGRGYSVLSGTTEYQCEFVIFAAPTFLAPYLVEGIPPLPSFEYSPWLTANLTMERLPASADVTWDNVVMESPALGYVDAMHQSVRTHIGRTVWTFYWALADGSAAQNRQLLLDQDWRSWKEAILRDLERVHPDIRACVSRVDIMRMGHAMARPTVGAIYDPARRRMAALQGRLLFANSDLSGFSIFEEAQYRGVRAAEHVLGVVGGSAVLRRPTGLR